MSSFLVTFHLRHQYLDPVLACFAGPVGLLLGTTASASKWAIPTWLLCRHWETEILDLALV